MYKKVATVLFLVCSCGGSADNPSNNDASTPGSVLAESTCGSSGCSLEVLNTSSEHYGLRIDIPPNALDSSADITVSVSDYEPDLPDGYSRIRRPVMLEPSGLVFNEPVIVTYSVPEADASNLVVLHFSPSLSSWTVPTLLNFDETTSSFVFSISGFSILDIVEEVNDAPVDLGFDLDRDSFPITNEADTCWGITMFTKWFFENIQQGDGLRASYSCNTARSIADDAAASKWSLAELAAMMMNLPFNTIQYPDIVFSTWLKAGLRVENSSQVLYMTTGALGFGDAHAVLVYGYSPPNFLVYDSNAEWFLQAVELSSGWSIEYPENDAGLTYQTFFLLKADSTFSSWFDMDEIYQEHSTFDGPCLDALCNHGFDADHDSWIDYDPDLCQSGSDYCDDDEFNHTQSGCLNCVDSDGDGYGSGCDWGDDCNDSDPSIHAGCPDCYSDSDCASNQWCDNGSCNQDECNQGENFCDGNDLRQCNQNGSGSIPLFTCNCSCVGGQCVTPCNPGTPRCSVSGDIEECQPDGCGWAFSQECLYNGCDNGICYTYTLAAAQGTTISSAFPSDNFDELTVTCNHTPCGDLFVGYDTNFLHPSGNLNAVRSLIQFDLSPIPAGSVISSAYLFLDQSNCSFTNGTYSFDMEILPVTQVWSEMSVTWSSMPTNGSVISTLTFPSNASLNYIDIDITTLVEDWLDGTQTNYGLLLKSSTLEQNADGTVYFYGNEASNPTRPKLYITITPP